MVIAPTSFRLAAAISAAALALASCEREPPARVSAAPAAPVASWGDADHDGIPDCAELTSYDDRANFRAWFTDIAETQFYEVSSAWNADQRDCAGLIRFAWREALRRHDRAWFQRMGDGYEPVAPDVRAGAAGRYLLGDDLFRVTEAPCTPHGPATGSFAPFADAQTLVMRNCTFVSRDRDVAQPGDLLVFRQPWVQKEPYHLMLFLGAARRESDGASDWVVYHTGARPDTAGAMRKVRLATLDHHPDPRWRPIARNRNFLGVYRLDILQ